MSHGGGADDRFMSDINVTPFVDVMLVLLIIFMVTAPMMMQGVDVDLPEATNEPLPSQDEALIVSIDKDGHVFIGDYEVAVDAMGQKLLTMLEGQEGRDVFMNADKTVQYGIVIRVMSEIKAAGIENVGMITVPEEQDSADRSKEVAAVQ
jgi:biopolymer transport protein TolR